MKLVLLVIAVGLMLACATDAQDDEDEGGAPAPIPYFGPSSLEERIASHKVVVRGNLDRTTSEVVAASGAWDGQYAVVIKFHLTVSEYLRGSGASEVVAVWGSSSPHPTEAAAEATRPSLVDARPTTWDGQEAVFFLHDETYDLFTALEAPNVYFLGYGKSFDHDDGFSINSRHNRVWLPAADESGSSGASGASGDARSYRLGPAPFASSGDGATGATDVEEPTVTLERLKELIALIDADIAKGDGSDEYEFCVETKYRLVREEAYLKLDPVRQGFYEPIIYPEASGQAPGTVLVSQYGSSEKGPPVRESKLTLDGPDGELFAVSRSTHKTTYASLGIDEFKHEVRATRPIPAGTYTVHAHYTPHIPANCTEHPLLAYEIELAFANGNGKAVHEAFFDVATIIDNRGQVSIGANATKGMISPREFDYGADSPAEIKSIEWRAGRVYVQVVPLAAVDDLQFGIVREDGSVHRFSVGRLSTFPNQNIIGYYSPTQPFEAGDKLIAGFYRYP